jgi:hypothetical protein
MAIQQHPLPQDISSYRFRLIGDMTIKQFASLAVCIILALITYSFPLPFFFKYPIVFAFLLLGVGMAFVPVQGRSLDVWLVAFIKSIYSPTQYTWKKASEGTPNAETAAPTKENNQALAQPVTNARIEITETPTSTPPLAPPVPSSEPIVASSPAPQSPTPVASTSSVIDTMPQANIPPNIVPQTPAPTMNLPIPFTPTTPNTLVGLSLNPTGHILDGVLIEIKKNNLTLRATKSNKLGQFMFARPLDSGLYQILAEKEGFSFAPYSLELTNEIVKPLKIQAQ